MDIAVARQHNTAIFTPTGRIEGSNADSFHEAITDAVEEEDQAIIIDLHQVSYVSSAGLRAFAIIHKATKNHDMRFAIVRASKPIKDVITVTGFTQLMAIHDTVDDALSQMAANPA